MTTVNVHDAGRPDPSRDVHIHDHPHSVKPYAIVFLLLLALLGCAVAVAYVPTENYTLRSALTAIAYTIAAVKAVLIILWFMHVKESSRLTWLVAGASFFWLTIMILLTLNDYWGRGAIPEAYRQAPHPVAPIHAQERRPTFVLPP